MGGDVTDEPQKQIVIATDDRARPLSASQYLAALDREPAAAPAKLVAVPG